MSYEFVGYELCNVWLNWFAMLSLMEISVAAMIIMHWIQFCRVLISALLDTDYCLIRSAESLKTGSRRSWRRSKRAPTPSADGSTDESVLTTYTKAQLNITTNLHSYLINQNYSQDFDWIGRPRAKGQVQTGSNLLQMQNQYFFIAYIN